MEAAALHPHPLPLFLEILPLAALRGYVDSAFVAEREQGAGREAEGLAKRVRLLVDHPGKGNTTSGK